MVMQKNRKGGLFTMEAFIAAMVVLITIAFFYSDPVDLPSFQEDEMNRRLEDCLWHLEIHSKLGGDLENEVLEEELGDCLPGGMGYEVIICDNGCDEGDIPEDRSVVSSGYFVASEEGPSEIVAYGWNK